VKKHYCLQYPKRMSKDKWSMITATRIPHSLILYSSYRLTLKFQSTRTLWATIEPNLLPSQRQEITNKKENRLGIKTIFSNCLMIPLWRINQKKSAIQPVNQSLQKNLLLSRLSSKAWAQQDPTTKFSIMGLDQVRFLRIRVQFLHKTKSEMLN